MTVEPDQDLTEQVFDFLYKQGADVIGIAPVERFKAVPQERHPRSILSSCLNVLVIGMRQIDSVIDNLPSSNYTFTQQYHLILKQLDDVGMSVSIFLSEKGYRSVQIPSEGFYDGNKRTMQGHLSHIEAAVFAGLGEKGLNNMLLTPKFGPRIQLASIVNDAPLKGSPRVETGLCKQWQTDCKKACISLCPAGCISEQGVDRDLCIYYQNNVLSGGIHLYISNVACGICVKACPKQLPD